MKTILITFAQQDAERGGNFITDNGLDALFEMDFITNGCWELEVKSIDDEDLNDLLADLDAAKLDYTLS